MGFRNGAYATVWEVTPMSDTFTKIKISVSRKNKQTGEYETDFSGFVGCIGTAAANKALNLKERDRIQLGDTDVSTTWNDEKKVQYTNFKVFSFELADRQGAPENQQHSVDDGEPEVDVENEDLPF